MNTKEMILAAGNRKYEDVTVEGLAEPIRVWSMTGLTNDRFDAETFRVGKDGKSEFRNEHYRARMFIACVGDADGNPLFGPEDLAAVSEMSSAVLNRVLESARRLNGMTPEDVERAGKN